MAAITPKSTAIELFSDDRQVVITMEFKSEADAEKAFDHMVAAIKDNRLVISTGQPVSVTEIGAKQ